MTYLFSQSSLCSLLLKLSTSSTLSPLTLHLAQDPLVLNSSIDMPIHLPLVIFILLVFLASGTLLSLSICSPCLFLKLSPLSSNTYGLTFFLLLMIQIPVLFISSVHVANVLFLCHCTPNHIFSSLLINFSPQFIRHLFISLLFNLFTSIHAFITYYYSLTSNHFYFVFVSGIQCLYWFPISTLLPLFCTSILCAVKCNNNNNNNNN